MVDRPEPDRRVATAPGGAGLGIPVWIRRVGVVSWLLIGFLAAVFAIAVLLASTSAITAPLVVAALLALVFAPVVTWLSDRGVPRSFAAGAVLVGLAVMTAAIVYLTVNLVVDISYAFLDPRIRLK